MPAWADERHGAFDFETSGTREEYALQPWRIATGDFWGTSLVWVDHTLEAHGGLNPDADMVERMLRWAIENKIILVGWNTVFDVSVCIAYGFWELVRQVRWLDGMLLWRHLEVEPEYGFYGDKRKAFGLKQAVREKFPDVGGYEDDVDYHDPSPEMREKLHAYNIRDSTFTLMLAKMFWNMLTPQQQKVATIEAQCIPMIARANFNGIIIDTLASGELGQSLLATSNKMFQKLELMGVTEEIVRSPTKLARLLFDEWNLPVYKTNKITPAMRAKAAKTGVPPTPSRSTDKETLFELSLTDPRAKDLMIYREALNNKIKFSDGLLKSVRYAGTGRSHPLAKVFGTYTGRMTYASKQKTVRSVKGAEIDDGSDD